jgi:hypothetical protein
MGTPSKFELQNATIPRGATERHYSPLEIAELWNISPEEVRRIFRDEAGVLVIGNPKPHYGRRRYMTLRIPEHVLERVHRRLSNV